MTRSGPIGLDPHGDRAEAAPSPIPDAHRPAFARWVAVIALLGLALRLAYVLVYRHDLIGGDGWDYSSMADAVADGQGFVSPLAPGTPQQTGRPPVWILVLSVASLVDGSGSFLRHQLAASLVGTGTVVLLALAGRQLASGLRSPERVGIAAAAIGAVYPGLWVYERAILSETMVMALVAAYLWLVYRFRSGPTGWLALGLGAGCGLLALTRAELVLTSLVLVTPLILTARSVPLRCRATWLAGAGLAALVVIAPWAGYNTARTDEFVPLTTGMGNAMVAGSCDVAYYGDRTGHYDRQCVFDNWVTGEGAARDRAQRSIARDYIEDHLDRLPVVVAAREARTWWLYQPTYMASFFGDWVAAPSWVTTLWLPMYYALVAAAVAGVVVLRRAGTAVWPLLVFAAIVATAVALTFGETRYRASAEVPLVLLGAVGAEAALHRWWPRSAGASLATSRG